MHWQQTGRGTQLPGPTPWYYPPYGTSALYHHHPHLYYHKETNEQTCFGMVFLLHTSIVVRSRSSPACPHQPCTLIFSPNVLGPALCLACDVTVGEGLALPIQGCP